MSEHHDLQLDERIRRANELTDAAAQRVLELWPSIEASLVEERPVVRRRRSSRRRMILIAVVIALVIGVVTAAVGGPLRHVFWDAENEPPRTAVTEPGNSASGLLAARAASTSTDPTDRALITNVVARIDESEAPTLDPGAPVRVADATTIRRRLVFVETTNGGFCFQMQGGQASMGGCSVEFGSNGVVSTSGAIAGSLVLEGFVAADVTRLQMQLRSGALEEIPIDHGMFVWREGNRDASRQATGLIATRAGTLIHERFPADAPDRRS